MVRSALFSALTLVLLSACQAAPRPVSPVPVSAPPPGSQTAVFAGGCFWGVEAVFESLKGVSSAVSGYAGGTLDHPTYEEVSSGTTGHAESVKVTFDPQVIAYTDLLKVFFSVVHDPTQKNYQGPDHGTQYRSAVFYADADQKAEAEAATVTLTKARSWPAPIVTEVTALKAFWPAEDYHQQFLRKNPDYPYIVRFDLPKLRALVKTWPDLVAATPVPVADAAAKTWHGLVVHSPDEALTFPVTLTDAQWRSRLSSLAYDVLRQEGTERPGSGPLLDEHRKGTFYSAATGQPLFRSEDKFESGTGWPSFTRPISPSALVLRLDDSLGMERVEVEDSSSGGHLGHVFDDGPAPKGLRYCMNSAALVFVADGDTPPALVRDYRP